MRVWKAVSMSRYRQEWQYRKVVMEAILDLLDDGKPRTAWQILHSLPYQDDFRVNKTLVNSILYSEAKRYVVRDNGSYTFRIRAAGETSYTFPPWDLVRSRIQSMLDLLGQMTVAELKDELENDGIPAPMWMIKAILPDDSISITLSSAKSVSRKNKLVNSEYRRMLADIAASS